MRLVSHANALTSSTIINCYVHGNINATDALKLARGVTEKFNLPQAGEEVPIPLLVPRQLSVVPPGSLSVVEPCVNPEEKNGACEVYFQCSGVGDGAICLV